MKKVFSTLLIICGLFISLNSVKANSYVLDNSAVDNLFASATELNLNTVAFDGLNAMNFPQGTATLASDKNAIVAAVLAFFLGGYAVHRYYLGTKGTMFFYYFCTCGGVFGVIPLIDFVMILVDNKDISKYCNNENFIMWN